jgi:ABC-type antimicrobial peptide transport system permease subunit
VSLLEDQGWARERLIASLFGAFALLALLLSATGLYSVVSYVVSQRRTEFGIRMALGATPGNIIWLVLKSALRPTLSGLTIGLGLCMAFNALLIRLTQATVRDPRVMTPIVALVIGMAIVAALVPACRAASGEPMSILHD